MSTENIVKFLQTAYTDEKLAALLAHAQDGKLSYRSCCCLVGLASAEHPFKQIDEFAVEEHFSHPLDFGRHESPDAWAISDAYCVLGKDDAERRERLIPLILAEMERRELAEQYRLEELAAAEEGEAIEASNLPDPKFESNGRY
ncbi:MAG TPA: hypothetical protein VHV32_19185 [Candidatus Angelobacter sp.]|jgi:hypothetical protein|nr:hypothetical protein [Candidatus Angelobacter sp.]